MKDATLAIGRMGDMGMIPTSAWLHIRPDGGFGAVLARGAAAARSPADAADAMVLALAQIRRIGVKLATMIVSALATPAVAPGLAPWFPALDANHLVVVDANVARAIDALRRRGPRTYAAYATWLRRHAAAVDLSRDPQGLAAPVAAPRAAGVVLVPLALEPRRDRRHMRRARVLVRALRRGDLSVRAMIIASLTRPL